MNIYKPLSGEAIIVYDFDNTLSLVNLTGAGNMELVDLGDQRVKSDDPRLAAFMMDVITLSAQEFRKGNLMYDTLLSSLKDGNNKVFFNSTFFTKRPKMLEHLLTEIFKDEALKEALGDKKLDVFCFTDTKKHGLTMARKSFYPQSNTLIENTNYTQKSLGTQRGYKYDAIKDIDENLSARDGKKTKRYYFFDNELVHLEPCKSDSRIVRSYVGLGAGVDLVEAMLAKHGLRINHKKYEQGTLDYELPEGVYQNQVLPRNEEEADYLRIYTAAILNHQKGQMEEEESESEEEQWEGQNLGANMTRAIRQAERRRMEDEEKYRKMQEKELGPLEMEKMRLKDEISKLVKQEEIQNKTLGQLESKNMQLKYDTSNLESNISNLESKKEKLERNISNLESKKEKLERDISNLERKGRVEHSEMHMREEEMKHNAYQNGNQQEMNQQESTLGYICRRLFGRGGE